MCFFNFCTLCKKKLHLFKRCPDLLLSQQEIDSSIKNTSNTNNKSRKAQRMLEEAMN